MSNPDRTNPPSAETNENEAIVSRRSLLLGSAGLTVGAAALTATAALGQQMVMAAHTDTASDNGSGRLYDINNFEGMTDIAHDPADIPPPITRRTPETVRV